MQNEDDVIVVRANGIQARNGSESRAPGQQRHPYVPRGAVGGSEPLGSWSPGLACHTILSPALSTLCTHADPSRTHPGSLLVTDLRCERGPGLPNLRTPAFEEENCHLALLLGQISEHKK